MLKIQNFVWQIFHHVLPVRGILFRRGLHIDPICPSCLDDMESMDHLFLERPISIRVLEGAVQYG